MPRPNDSPFSIDQTRKINAHLGPIADLIRNAPDSGPPTEYVLRRLVALTMQGNEDATYLELMSALGHAAGANVLAEIYSLIATGEVNWGEVGRALGVSAQEARGMFARN